jgi:hypothetical protein
MTYTPDALLQSQAKVLASAILAGAGVKLQWHDPNKCPAEAILITLLGEVPARFMPGVLAYALPFEGTHIVVFSERAKHRPAPARSVLAHVIVHEITHILEGISLHSDKGVMKAEWSGTDYQEMIRRPLQFTEDDVWRIQRGLKWWVARRASGRDGHGPVALQ